MSGFTVESIDELVALKAAIIENANRSMSQLADLLNDPMKAMFAFKFDSIGFHPTAGHELNLIEQVNQTFSYLCALEASEYLLKAHSEVSGLKVYPGAHAPRGTLDIEAIDPAGCVGAEIFSAVSPRNNNKLNKDLDKLRDRQELHRYVFFICPTHQENKRQPALENYGVEVRSLWPFK